MVRTGRAQGGTSPTPPPWVALAQTPGHPPTSGCFLHIPGRGIQKNRVGSVWAEGRGRKGFGCRLPLEGSERRSISPSGGGKDAELGHPGSPSLTHRGWMEGRRLWARSRRVGSGNPSGSCLAFVGLSWTLNVFLIKRLSVSKPPPGVYSLAIKWERGISLPPAMPENIPWGLGGGRKLLHREQCSYPDSYLELSF